MTLSTGEYLIQLLEAYGVDKVFGIPGVHTVELYRGLADSSIQHVTPRHEQGAGFMADGYARMCGKPGVCLVITGPGLSNISTAMLQARADSIPMLVISSVNNPDRQARGSLHEMPDQSAFARSVAVESYTVSRIEDLAKVVEAAFTRFGSARPGPVHIEIPLSLMQADCGEVALPSRINAPADKQADTSAIDQATDAINTAERVVILAGGGTGACGEAVVELAERLGALVITTANARSHVPTHPLVIHASASLKPIREYIEAADVVLAVGTELGPTDYDVYETEGPMDIKCLVRIDIDDAQLDVNQNAKIKIACAAEAGVNALLSRVKSKKLTPDTDQLYKSIQGELSHDYKQLIGVLENLRSSVDSAVFVGDSTQLIYAGNLAFAPDSGGAWFNSSVGFGTLGYGLSAAIGAKLACPSLPVICLIGDGGLQFTLAELGTLRELDLAVTIIVWNNHGYGEIREFMKDKGIKPEGVDLEPPDFCAVASAYGLDSVRVTRASELIQQTEQAVSRNKSLLIDVIVDDNFVY